MIPILSVLWLLTTFDGNYYARQESSGTFTVKHKPNYAVMLTQECGDLTGQYLQVTIQVDGNEPQFSYRGQGVWNGGRTNFVRLFFTSSTNTYSSVASGLSGRPNDYWWSTSYFFIDPAKWSLGWPSTLSGDVYPWQWTNGIGHNGITAWNEFMECARNARQVGISFGGGFFDDSGICGSGTISVTTQ